MLVPSSNTVLEPYTSAMFQAVGDRGSVHYARFRVVEISLSSASRGQFDLGPILEAAERLAETEPDLIVWNGTSASWLGLETDHRLCAAITERTGVAATSTSLAFDALFQGMGIRRIAVVTPYLPEIQTRIVANLALRGISVVAEAHLSDKGNHSFAGYGPDVVADLVRKVASAGPEAIAIICTNFRGAGVAEMLEADLTIPVFDSVAVTAAYAMHATGLDPSLVRGWGSVFQRTTDFI
ncbi:aspartate/glutamate racemase family protein [Pseudotabrizicola sp.]|uniref:maleate cis-trans isomerase family protein n=1 Tax=Pseudotabrizicola sp. TaxID=2939647 RepID=UPI0027320A62|nr:aspartate/glutamate racemase family protein [Pseudotabrizicola sp.]MDP2079869.1 aspartate/glutamate racemase family protein [Pseudotabrizicola sp.]